jgi:P-type Ca2+ transporter type 2C
MRYFNFMKIYKLSKEEVYQRFDTSSNGLNIKEVELRLQKYGPNQLEEIKKKHIIYKFLYNFYHLLALLLWAASILAFIAGLPQLSIAIIAVIVVNALFSFWQEYEAEKAVSALKKILPPYAKVIRDGDEGEILATELVPGDMLILEEGDNISADARLVESYEMTVNGSTLTGESRPVRKTSDAAMNDADTNIGMPNLVFAGTSVASGSGRAVVFGTGMNTEFSKIASLTQAVEEEQSPLQKQINRITQIIAILASVMGIVLFAVNVSFLGMALSLGFLFAIGLTVANVPEGLLPTVTLALAASARKMVKKNALVKRLSSVETLGSTTVICTDKTGTITKNEMTIREIWISDKIIEVTGAGYDIDGEFLLNGKKISHEEVKELDLLMLCSTFCNDAKFIPPRFEVDGKTVIMGDPTEVSLLVAASKIGFNWRERFKQTPRIYELPFDSKRKMMSSIHQKADKRIAYIKGAPKKVLKLSNFIIEDGEIRAFREGEKEKIIEKHDEIAGRGLRILGMAFRYLDEVNEYKPENVEKELIFVGMMAMQDPPRPEVKEAVEKCHAAGIEIIMITGDYGLTACAIAREVGIVTDDCRIIKGKDMEKLSDEELVKELEKGDMIFARAVPLHKMRIAALLRKEGHIVAMTGDGVNDAPALKQSDIGVSMGVCGTDVAKEASDMVLADDNFATIVSAVKEGRTIYENIRKFITYIFAHETAEIIPFVFMVLFRIPLPLTVMQILAIDLGTDTLPALALGMSPSESDVMNIPPRSRKERLLNLPVFFRGYVYLGLVEAALIMSGYFWALYTGGWHWGQQLDFSDPLYKLATTMAFAGIVTCQIGNLVGCQTTRTSIFKVGISQNTWIIRGIIFEVIVLLSIVYIPPLQGIFGTTGLGMLEWLILISFIPIMFVAEEFRKFIVRKMRK